jgi:cobalamin biosynthesis Mg chelatase CobN
LAGNNGLNGPLNPSARGERSRWRQRRIPMEPILDAEPILIVIVVVLLFGGGYWGRRPGAS